MPVTSTSSTTTITPSTSTEMSTSTQVGDDDEDEDGSQYDDQICWETMIGQEIVKLVTMELYITIISIFVIDFLRGIWIRYCSSFWCWDIENFFVSFLFQFIFILILAGIWRVQSGRECAAHLQQPGNGLAGAFLRPVAASN